MEERSIPSFPDFYRRVKGTEPSGPLWDVYSKPLAVDNAMLRTIVMPPGVAAGRRRQLARRLCQPER